MPPCLPASLPRIATPSHPLPPSPTLSHPPRHVCKLDRWLRTLSTQITASMPAPKPEALPASHEVREWANQLIMEAISYVRSDKQAIGCISMRTALLVQQAVVVGLVVGIAFPPIRLDLIKTLPHPKHRVQCRDKDCLLRNGTCLGNRISINRGAAPEPGPEATLGGGSGLPG